MGNRLVINFYQKSDSTPDDSSTPRSKTPRTPPVVGDLESVEVGPTIYLHWSGEAFDWLREFLKDWKRWGDLPYMSARFIGLCAAKMPGDLSLGTWNCEVCNTGSNAAQWSNLTAESRSHGDQGILLVDADTGWALRAQADEDDGWMDLLAASETEQEKPAVSSS